MEEIGKEALLKLIEFIETVSPQLWEIAMRQVYVSIFKFAFLGTVSIVLFSIAAWSMKKIWSNTETDDDDFSAFMGSLLISLFSLAGIFIGLVGAISRIINPRYYAIDILLQMFGVG